MSICQNYVSQQVRWTWTALYERLRGGASSTVTSLQASKHTAEEGGEATIELAVLGTGVVFSH